ncbi:MAG: OmpA family protein [Bacteroidales bacterium]|jgi:hypothetical protein|nr:OmpA family protein [Bacteroidales bacterium]
MKNGILIALLFINFSAIAQQKGHYLSIEGGVGFSTLQYKLDDGNRKGGLGLDGKLGYTFFFTPNWGIGTGLGISRYVTKGTIDNGLFSFEGQIDSEGDVYRRDVYLYNWKEKQKSPFLEIPLLASFQYKFKEEQKFMLYANAGLKFQFPMKKKYNVEKGDVETQGYYARWNVILIDKGHGFSTVHDYHPSGKFKLNMGMAATIEAGFLYELDERWDLFAGVAMNYGFLDMKKESEALVFINTNNETDYRSMLSSNSIGKVRSFSVTGQVGVRFRLGAKKKRDLPPPQKDIIPEIVVIHDRNTAMEDSLKRENERLRKEKFDEDMYILLQPIDQYRISIVTLTDEQKKRIDKNIEILKEYPDLKIRLEGHTCDIDNSHRHINKEIGLHRAENVEQYLIENGISPSRLSVSSKGESEPRVPNDSEGNRRRNRRVMFVVVE